MTDRIIHEQVVPVIPREHHKIDFQQPTFCRIELHENYLKAVIKYWATTEESVEPKFFDNEAIVMKEDIKFLSVFNVTAVNSYMLEYHPYHFGFYFEKRKQAIELRDIMFDWLQNKSQ